MRANTKTPIKTTRFFKTVYLRLEISSSLTNGAVNAKILSNQDKHPENMLLCMKRITCRLRVSLPE